MYPVYISCYFYFGAVKELRTSCLITALSLGADKESIIFFSSFVRFCVVFVVEVGAFKFLRISSIEGCRGDSLSFLLKRQIPKPAAAIATTRTAKMMVIIYFLLISSSML